MGPCAAPGCPAPRPRRAGHQSQSAACVEDREEPPTAGLPAPGSRRRCPPLSGVGHRRPPPSAGHRPVSARASGCPCLASGHSRWTFGTGRGRGSVVVASPPLPRPARYSEDSAKNAWVARGGQCGGRKVLALQDLPKLHATPKLTGRPGKPWLHPQAPLTFSLSSRFPGIGAMGLCQAFLSGSKPISWGREDSS